MPGYGPRCPRGAQKTNPAQLCDAGAQEEAIADGGSYPAALGD